MKYCSNVDRPRDDHTKWSKSERERQTPYDITYILKLKIIQMNLYTKQKEAHKHRNKFMVRGGRLEGKGRDKVGVWD